MSIRLGLFDSGLGGLTVLRRVLERHGSLPVIYLGDTARVPYGSRSPSEIRSIASEVVGWLRQQNVSTVVMACNTTNALAREVTEGQAGVPVVGLIGAAAAMVRESRVGVLATPATVASGAYRESIEALNPGTLVVQQACPDFVPLIESGICAPMRCAMRPFSTCSPCWRRLCNRLFWVVPITRCWCRCSRICCRSPFV